MNKSESNGIFKFYPPLQTAADAYGPESAARDLALQDDSLVKHPEPQGSQAQAAPNPALNLYWGELHLHTAESFDATLMGNTLTIEDAYRFARGEALRSDGGEQMQLSRPLDFVAITDHAEAFGTRTRCGDPNLSWFDSLYCSVMEWKLKFGIADPRFAENA